MRYFGTMLAGAALATLVACGDSTGPAGEQNNPGTGTSTLRVEARIDGEDAVGGFTTAFTVTVELGDGTPVSGAEVTIRNNEMGAVTLLETQAGNGVYRATENSFPDGDFQLDVVSGDDNVHDVVLGGIGIHEITAPLSGSTVTANTPLTVTWTAPAVARGAQVDTRDYDGPVLADNGEAVIAAEDNPERAEQRIRVYRFNEVDILGGLAGSDFRVTLRNTVEPITVAPAAQQN